MKGILGSVLAVLTLAISAQASDIPFVPECRMDFKVSSFNAIVGIGGGKGVIHCHDKYNGDTEANVDIAIMNTGSVGVFSESGTVYAAGIGGNADAMLGVLLRAQAAAALGHYGRAYSSGVMVKIDSRPSAQVFLSTASSRGLGGAFGWGGWFFAKASDRRDDSNNDNIFVGPQF